MRKFFSFLFKECIKSFTQEAAVGKPEFKDSLDHIPRPELKKQGAELH